jgi:hypothetical protein
LPASTIFSIRIVSASCQMGRAFTFTLAMSRSAEELRGQLNRFYVKQVETGDAGEFSRMSDEELRAFVYGDHQGLCISLINLDKCHYRE